MVPIVPDDDMTMIINQFDGGKNHPSKSVGGGTSQKNRKKKKLKGSDGVVIDSNSLIPSMASTVEDRREK